MPSIRNPPPVDGTGKDGMATPKVTRFSGAVS